jgi:putative flippase GtrA
MKTFWQFVRYATIGVLSNALLYGGYLLLTMRGIGHKTAMSLVYLGGILITFSFNRHWTFSYEGRTDGALFRYFSTYVTGYVFNFSALWVLTDFGGFPHQAVQAVLILLTAALIFLLQKVWVFPAPAASSSE